MSEHEWFHSAGKRRENYPSPPLPLILIERLSRELYNAEEKRLVIATAIILQVEPDLLQFQQLASN